MRRTRVETSESRASRWAWHRKRMADAQLYELLMSIKPDGLTPNAWASRAGVSRNWFNDVRRGAKPRTDTLEKVVQAIEYTLAQFYDLQGAREAASPEASSRANLLPFRSRDEPLDLPLLGTAQGSDLQVMEDGEVRFVERMDLSSQTVVEYLRRPVSLAGRREVYVITVMGDSMATRYEDGDPAYVDPKRQPKTGDYVVVQLKREGDDGEEQLYIALLKKLVRRTSTYIELCQTNPPVTFQIPLHEVHAVHRVIPWREIVFF